MKKKQNFEANFCGALGTLFSGSALILHEFLNFVGLMLLIGFGVILIICGFFFIERK